MQYLSLTMILAKTLLFLTSRKTWLQQSKVNEKVYNLNVLRWKTQNSLLTSTFKILYPVEALQMLWLSRQSHHIIISRRHLVIFFSALPFLVKCDSRHRSAWNNFVFQHPLFHWKRCLLIKLLLFHISQTDPWSSRSHLKTIGTCKILKATDCGLKAIIAH